jgi:glycerol uptake facilitator-like aquaporin
MNPSFLKPCVAEFVGTFALIFVGVGALHSHEAGAHWNNHLVFWIGPLLGGALVRLVYGCFLIEADK